MAATFEYEEDNGTQTGSPLKGTTRTAARTEVNWKNIDDSTTAYSSNPITAGNNSFTKYQFGHFSGSFNQVSAGLWAHTLTAFGTGLTLKAQPTCTSTATALVYATPSTTTNAGLTLDATTAISIGSGVQVQFTATGPENSASASATSLSTNPCYTNYLASQLQTTGSAAAGDTAQVTLTLQYNEN